MKRITEEDVKLVLIDLMLRREKQIAEGVTPFVIDDKIKAWKKMLNEDYRLREEQFRIATANSLVGYERFGIYQEQLIDLEEL